MQAFKNESSSIAPAHWIQLGTMEYSTLTPRGSELAAKSLNLQNWNLQPRIIGAAKMNDMSAVIGRSRRRHGRCRNTRRHRHIASQHLHDRRVQRIIGSAGSGHRNGMTAKSHFKWSWAQSSRRAPRAPRPPLFDNVRPSARPQCRAAPVRQDGASSGVCRHKRVRAQSCA